MSGRSLAALGLCLALVACGGDDDADEPPLNPEIPLNQVINDPGAYDTVSLTGEASPLGDLGFVLTQQGVSIFVDAKPTVARTIDDGEQVDVTASVEIFSSELAARIDTQPNPGDDDAISERALVDTRIEEGAPYLRLIALAPADD